MIQTSALQLQGSLFPAALAPGPAPSATVPTVLASITLPAFNLQSFDTAAQAQVTLPNHCDVFVPCSSNSPRLCTVLHFQKAFAKLCHIIHYTQYVKQTSTSQ